jgi:hypothetical protein
LWAYGLDGDDLQVDLFDTQSIIPKAIIGKKTKGLRAAAYVWSRDGILYCAEHKGTQFHHSSFLSGKKVRCAGMIDVEGGKVKRVTNDSGHYKPQTRHLRSFVQFLQMHNVFTHNAEIDDHFVKPNQLGLSPQDFLSGNINTRSQSEVRSEVERIMQTRKDWERLQSRQTSLRDLVEIRFTAMRKQIGPQAPEHALWTRAYRSVCLDFAAIDSKWKMRANAPPIPRTRAVRH